MSFTIQNEPPIPPEISRFLRTRAIPVVFSGPSGVGKDAVLEHFLPANKDCVRLVTVTTRQRRDYEIDGKDYTFLTEAEFRRLKDSGGLLEYADVYGSWYGSPRQWVLDRMGEGKNVILKLDVQGGVSVKRELAAENPLMVFLAPPSLAELERRLRGRGSETEDSLRRRLSKAEAEMEIIPEYQYVVVNDTIEQAASDLAAIIRAEILKVRVDE